jgi:hypothetical protein
MVIDTGESARFPNTKEGRKAAEEYSYSIGRGGFWEDFVDHDEEPAGEAVVPEDDVDPETKILLAVAYVALRDPDALSAGDMTVLGTRLAEKGVPIEGLPADPVADASTISKIGTRIIPIATDGGVFEEVSVVEAKDPMWRNILA